MQHYMDSAMPSSKSLAQVFFTLEEVEHLEAPRLTECHRSPEIPSAPGARVIFRFFWEASRPGLEFFFLCRVLVTTLTPAIWSRRGGFRRLPILQC